MFYLDLQLKLHLSFLAVRFLHLLSVKFARKHFSLDKITIRRH